LLVKAPEEHEEPDVNVRAILGFGFGLTAGGLAVYLVVWLLFVYLDRRERPLGAPDFPLAVGHESRLPPEPRLQEAPRADLERVRAAELERLNGYLWIDKAAGTVRIPISEAMKLTVERGLPSRPAAGGAAR
jgi:hypothetical protein